MDQNGTSSWSVPNAHPPTDLSRFNDGTRYIFLTLSARQMCVLTPPDLVFSLIYWSYAYTTKLVGYKLPLILQFARIVDMSNPD